MYEVLLFAGMALGLILIPFGIPGTVVMFASALIYAWGTGFSGNIGWTLLVILGVLTLLSETADNWLMAIGAKRYGASTGSMWLSLLGGLFGGIIIGGPLMVISGPLGPVIGGFLGAFAIVVVHEHSIHRNWKEALRAGWGTFLGRMAGIFVKIVLAVAMIIVTVFAVLF